MAKFDPNGKTAVLSFLRPNAFHDVTKHRTARNHVHGRVLNTLATVCLKTADQHNFRFR